MPQFWPGADADPALAARREEESLAITAALLSLSEPLPWPEDEPDAGLAWQGPELFDALGCRGCHLLGDERAPGAGAAEPVDAWADFDAPVEPVDAWADFDEPAEDAAPVEAPWERFAEEVDAAAPWLPADLRPERVDQPLGFGPVLGAEGARARGPFLVQWLRDPSALWAQARMPTLQLDEDQVQALASWLSQLGAEHRPGTPEALLEPDEDLVAQGVALIDRYGCAGCHEIPGFEELRRPGPELESFGRKEPEELFFADLPPERWTWEVFTQTKLATPRRLAAADIQPVMPDYELDEEEVEALLVFLGGLRGERLPAGLVAPDPVDPRLRLAERLVRERNCAGCHSLAEAQPGRIARYSEESWRAPPSLVGEGARVQPQWLHGFLQRPTVLRGWLALRMPDFRLSEDEAAALVAWFGAAVGRDSPFPQAPPRSTDPSRVALGEQAFVQLKCLSCHSDSAGGLAGADRAPDLALAPGRLEPDWVRGFLHDPDALLPGTRMPQFFPYGQSPLPELLDGDTDAQIELLVEQLMRGRQ